MADAVTTTTIQDGDRIAVATTPTICWDLNSDYTTDEDFTGFGGIQNTAASSGKTGDIALTTTGHTAGDSYVIVLTLIKSYD